MIQPLDPRTATLADLFAKLNEIIETLNTVRRTLTIEPALISDYRGLPSATHAPPREPLKIDVPAPGGLPVLTQE